jgi:hypothetical protein
MVIFRGMHPSDLFWVSLISCQSIKLFNTYEQLSYCIIEVVIRYLSNSLCTYRIYSQVIYMGHEVYLASIMYWVE